MTEAEKKAKEEADKKAAAKAASAKVKFNGPKELSAINIAGREYEVKGGVIELEPGFTDQEVENLQTFGFTRDLT